MLDDFGVTVCSLLSAIPGTRSGNAVWWTKVDFHTARTIVHYKLSPQSIFCTSNLDFHMLLMNEHFELSHSDAVTLRSKLCSVSSKCLKRYMR